MNSFTRFLVRYCLWLLLVVSLPSLAVTTQELQCFRNSIFLSGVSKRAKDPLNAELAKLTDDRRQKLVDILDAVQLMTPAETTPELLDIFQGRRSIWDAKFTGQLDPRVRALYIIPWGRDKGRALSAFRGARDLLLETGKVSSSKLGEVAERLYTNTDAKGKWEGYADGHAKSVDALLDAFRKDTKSFNKPPKDTQLNAYLEKVAGLLQEVMKLNAWGAESPRVANLLLAKLLSDNSLPPARAFDLSRAAEMSTSELADRLLDAIQSTKALRADLAQRLADGRPLENSPELVTTFVPRVMVLARKVQGKPKLEAPLRGEAVDADQFAAYLRTRLQLDPKLAQELAKAPDATSAKLRADFDTFYAKKRLYFINAKDEKETLALSMVEPDFYREFGVATFRDAEKWKAKMDRWNIPQVVWRGLSYADRDWSEAEVLSTFMQLHPQLISNQGLKGRTTQEGMRRSALADFDRYNQDLITGNIVKAATDHAGTGPTYPTSWGYSTSAKQIVGKAFAMGAMVHAPYGEHAKPEIQEKLASRINIGVYRGKKDVDLMRLHQHEPGFVYQYARQAEVTGVGAVDPDSVMIVQKVGADGEVQTSYVRNPKNPAEIWVINGDFDVEAGKAPKKAQLVKTIKLDELPTK